jgi:hypothetical protein
MNETSGGANSAFDVLKDDAHRVDASDRWQWKMTIDKIS